MEKIFDIASNLSTSFVISFILVLITAILSTLITRVMTRRSVKKNVYEERFNPYIVGEAVHDPDMFFGRSRELTDIFNSLQVNSICLIGERRIGKTTILEHVVKNAQKPYFSFFCDLESVREPYFFSRVMQALVNEVESKWKIKRYLDLDFFEKKPKDYDNVDFDLDIDFLLRFLMQKFDPAVTIIMCLDEFDKIIGFTPQTLQSLRNVVQTSQGKLRMVAAAVSIKKDEWAEPTSPWYNFFESQKILPFDKDQAELLITKPVKGFYTYDREAINFILQVTDCKPYYIQMICKRAISYILDRKRQKVGYDDVETIYKNILRELNSEFEKFWENLSENLRKILLKGESQLVSKEYEKELLDNQYNHSHKVILVENRNLRFSRIFKDWLKEQHYAETEEDETEVILSYPNAIKQLEFWFPKPDVDKFLDKKIQPTYLENLKTWTEKLDSDSAINNSLAMLVTNHEEMNLNVEEMAEPIGDMSIIDQLESKKAEANDIIDTLKVTDLRSLNNELRNLDAFLENFVEAMQISQSQDNPLITLRQDIQNYIEAYSNFTKEYSLPDAMGMLFRAKKLFESAKISHQVFLSIRKITDSEFVTEKRGEFFKESDFIIERSRLAKKRHELERQYDLLSEQIRTLANSYIIENDPFSQFKLKSQLEAAEREREHLDKELESIENEIIWQNKDAVPKKLSLNLGQRRRLEQQVSEYQERYNLTTKKLVKLEHALVIETDPNTMFKLETQIGEVKSDRYIIEQRLSELESRLSLEEQDDLLYISYNQKDVDFVVKLKNALEAQNIKVTIDIEAMKFGDNLDESMRAPVREAGFRVSVVSENSLKSIWGIEESLRTLMHEEGEGGKRFVPIYIDKKFLDDAFYLEIIDGVDQALARLKELTVQAIERNLGTANYDKKRKRLVQLRNNLDRILERFNTYLVGDFSSDEKFAENLPRLVEVIREHVRNSLEEEQMEEQERDHQEQYNLLYISYNRKDADFVMKLKNTLETQNIKVTIDIETAKFGDNFDEFMKTSVQEAGFTVSVVSENSLKSIWGIEESLRTLMHEEGEGGKRFVPIYIDKKFLDDAFYLEIVDGVDQALARLKELTIQAIERNLGTANYDKERKRLVQLRSNLDRILERFNTYLVGDFSTDEKFAENLPKLVEVIKECMRSSPGK